MRTLTKARDTYVAYAKLARLRGLMRLRKEKHCSKHRHLLLFANTFPPEFNSGVHRPLALVKYAANSGWKVTVVAGSPDGCAAAGATLAETIPDAVDILHWQNTLDYFWRLVPELDGGFGPCFAALELAVHHEPTTPYSIIMATGPSFSSFPAACAAGTQLRVPVVLDYRDEWSGQPL